MPNPASRPQPLALLRSTGGKAGLVSALRGLSGAFTLIVAGMVTWLYGPKANGELFVAIAWISILGTVGVLGLPDVALRHVALARSSNQRGASLRISSRSLRLVIVASSSVAANAAVAFTLTGVGAAGSYLAITAVPAAAISLLTAKLLTGLEWPLTGELVGRILPQALLGTGVLLAVGMGMVSGGLVAVVVIAYWSAALLGVALLWLSIRSSGEQHHGQTQPPDTPRVLELARQGVPLMLSASIALLPQWLDVLMLNAYLGPAEAGTYTVAARASALIGLVLVGANAVAAPRFARLYASGRLQDLRTLAAVVNTWTTLVAIVIALSLNVIAWLVAISVTPDIHQVRGVLAVASAAQLLNVSFGVVLVLLVMTGHQAHVLVSSSVALGVNVALNLILIPPLGMIGAASASLVSVLAANAVGAGMVWKHLRIRPLVISFKVTSAAGSGEQRRNDGS